ncbi:unnamed protein product [Orchesella dallaii]|uniref:Uncharacterized protein n=1 Tax=Orchesella dallaii TaxID=48710 RepID=A0ABP1RX04_9HEXA
MYESTANNLNLFCIGWLLRPVCPMNDSRSSRQRKGEQEKKRGCCRGREKCTQRKLMLNVCGSKQDKRTERKAAELAVGGSSTSTKSKSRIYLESHIENAFLA